jgi:hypothetical protein
MERTSFHPPRAWIFEVAAGLLESLCSSVLQFEATKYKAAAASCVVQAVTCWLDDIQKPPLSRSLRCFWILIVNFNGYFMFAILLLEIKLIYVFYRVNCEGEASSIEYFSIYVLVFFFLMMAEWNDRNMLLEVHINARTALGCCVCLDLNSYI